MDRFTPFGIIAGFTERLVMLTDDPARPDQKQFDAVLREIGAGLWGRDLFQCWAHVLATLTPTPNHSSAESHGTQVIGQGDDTNPGRWPEVGAALVDAAHQRRLADLHQAVTDVFGLGMPGAWYLAWRMAGKLAGPLGDGGPRAAAVIAAAAATDTDTFLDRLQRLAADDEGQLLWLVKRWGAIVLATCETPGEVAPRGSALHVYLDAVLTGDDTAILAAQMAWLVCTAAQSAKRSVAEELYPLARAMHAVLDAVGGAARLRAALLLHVDHFPPAEALLCRRAAAIAAAAASGHHDAMTRYTSAMVAVHGEHGLSTVMNVWLDLLGERLHYVDGGDHPAGGRRRHPLLNTARAIHKSDADRDMRQRTTTVVSGGDERMASFVQLATLIGHILTIAEHDDY
jgi:hypothetical protein